MIVGAFARAARLVAVSIVCTAALGGSVAAAASPVRPVLGRWEGRDGPAKIVFTVEESGRGVRYLVRPVIYCDPGTSTFFETSLFSLLQPDAWPISKHGVLRAAPLVGGFEPDRARLTVAAGGTCAPPGTGFDAEPQAAHPTVLDGDWTLQIAPHMKGILGEFATWRTRGEGATVDSDWGVYDGLESCYVQRSPLELLVEANGSFDATINGNQLSSENRTIHITGSFLSSNTVRGTYTVTGPGCTGQPVEFAGVLTSAYTPPKPPSGSVTLIGPRNGPGGGGESPPEGAECQDAGTLSPRFAPEEKREIPLGSFKVGSLPFDVSGALSLGSVGVCERALEKPSVDLAKALSELDVQARYERGARKVNSLFRYTFLPLGWHLPGGTGAPKPAAPVIDWPTATLTLPGGVEGPSVNFLYTPGKSIGEVDLIKVPVLQESATLIALGKPFLSARLGPELSLGVHVNPKELDRQLNENVDEGESPETAARQIANEIKPQLTEEIDAQEQALSPDQAAPAEFGVETSELSNAVGERLASQLPEEAGGGPIADRVAASAITRGLLGSPSVVSDVEVLVGDEIVEVGIFGFAAGAHHGLPPGVHRVRGRLQIPGQLRARPIHKLRRHALRRAPFPARRIRALVRDTFSLPVPALVGRLAVSTRRLSAGGAVTVIAPFLGVGRPHDALLTLAGPRYRATRLLHVAHGAAGATIKLPQRLTRGTWTISVEDLSGVALGPDGRSLTGSAIIRMGVFDVR